MLLIGGSPSMAGAIALSGLAAMRSGAGLVTLGIPESLNSVVQKKISPVLMTLGLKETKAGTISPAAFPQIQKFLKKCNCLGIGPGLTTHPQTQKFILKVIRQIELPMVIDADGLNTLAADLKCLRANSSLKILTPHPGEMARLTGLKKSWIEAHRIKAAENFAVKNKCVLLLKGHRTVLASPEGKIYINKTGNAGMAKAGSGDVLTGMIAAFLAQGLSGFEAAKWGAFLHGKAGDLAAEEESKTALIATDIIDQIPNVFKKFK